MTTYAAPVKYSDVFVVEPEILEFNAYEIGETYELRVTIRNKSKLSRRLRILPPASRDVPATELEFPS